MEIIILSKQQIYEKIKTIAHLPEKLEPIDKNAQIKCKPPPRNKKKCPGIMRKF